MLRVEEALERLLALSAPLPSVTASLEDAVGCYLANEVAARRTQPAADLSAMDGYAFAFADLPGPWHIVGESAAGRPFDGTLSAGEAVRIFTGAHVPTGADCILIQENAERRGEYLHLAGDGINRKGQNIRLAGGDFHMGDPVLRAGMMLGAGQIALAAMAGYGALAVGKRPKVHLLATGDELVAPGVAYSRANIPSSNNVMLSALLRGLPCDVTDNGIVADNLPALEERLGGMAPSADIIVTTGGASVGDHDLVQAALRNRGAQIDFWKVAMRPGKPIMAGTLGNALVLGLPGNPASAFVTAFLFLCPLVRHIAGSLVPFNERCAAETTTDLPKGGLRTEFLRAFVRDGKITADDRQDSGMVSPLSNCNALLIQDIDVPSRARGSVVRYLPLA